MKLFTQGLDLSDQDVKVLSNDLLDIEEWVRAALQGKINNCYKRLKDEWINRLLVDPEIARIVADRNGLISQITGHRDYRNRLDREAEAAAILDNQKIC